MNDHIAFEQALKENMLRLVEHHRRHCDGPDCDISLWEVRQVMERAGITLTDEEKRRFM